jgi:hypothetical protein
MRAPANKRSTDEIVAEIMKLVGCPEVEVYVRRLIDHLRTKPPPFSGNRKENTERAKDLRKRMKKLVRMLKAPHSRFFLGDRFWSVFWSPLYMPGDVIELNPQTRTYIAQESPRLKHLAEELSFFSSRCDQIIKLKLGQHGRVKYQQRFAASASRAILREAANRGTELRLTDSPTGKLCLIASLFFEAATGKYDAHLRQACKAVLNAKT